MHTSLAGPKAGRTTAKMIALLVALAATAVSLMAFNAGSASAADQGFIFDEGRINLGDLKGLEIIDPSIPDDPATLSGQLDESGNFTAPKEGFVFPDKLLEDVDADVLTVNIVAHFSAGNDIKGTFDSDSGVLEITQFPLNASFDIYPSPQSSGTPIEQCAIAGVPVLLNTETALPGDPDPFPGSPFTPEGAAATTWESLPPVTGGPLCGLAAGLLGGPGGLWLAGKATDEPPDIVVAPKKAPALNSKPDASTTETGAAFSFAKAGDETEPVTGFDCKLDAFNWSPCNDGTKAYTDLKVGTHTFKVRATNQSGAGPETTYEWEIKSAVQPKPAFGPLKVTPKSKTVKRGKKVVFTAKIKNTGNATATGVKVCVKAPAKVVSVKKCVTVGKVAAGSTGTAKFKVTVKKKAKGKKASLAFTATAKGVAKKTAKATVKVKK